MTNHNFSKYHNEFAEPNISLKDTIVLDPYYSRNERHEKAFASLALVLIGVCMGMGLGMILLTITAPTSTPTYVDKQQLKIYTAEQLKSHTAVINDRKGAVR